MSAVDPRSLAAEDAKVIAEAITSGLPTAVALHAAVRMIAYQHAVIEELTAKYAALYELVCAPAPTTAQAVGVASGVAIRCEGGQ